MLFIEAINKLSTQSNEKKLIKKGKKQHTISQKDSVDLSLVGHQVKEIHLNSQEKVQINAATSVFANVIEHVLKHVIDSNLNLHSPEELSLDTKNWTLSLQIPPVNTHKIQRKADYIEPEIHDQPPAKELIFYIPVKPSYGIPIEMTLLLSPHYGSPETPNLFHTFPKESWLPILNTPYPPHFLAQQLTYHHIFLDQDGEFDQLSPIYSHIQKHNTMMNKDSLHSLSGLRVWHEKSGILSPIALGDSKIGLLFVEHLTPLLESPLHNQKTHSQTGNIYTKA